MYLQYRKSERGIKAVSRSAKHVAPHLHDALEMVYVTEGTLELGVAQELYHMEAGDLGFVFPNVIHHYQVFGQDPHRASFIQLPSLKLGPFGEELQRMAPQSPLLSGKDLTDEIRYAIEAIMRTPLKEEIVAVSYATIILAKCMPALSLVEKSAVGSDDIVYQVVSYVSTHFRESVSLERMAFDLGVSKYVLSRVFSGTFHTNFSQYLNDARLNYAVHCLENTGDTVLDICLDSGFESQRTFNRVFKDRYHVSPSEYRNLWLPNARAGAGNAESMKEKKENEQNV